MSEICNAANEARIQHTSAQEQNGKYLLAKDKIKELQAILGEIEFYPDQIYHDDGTWSNGYSAEITPELYNRIQEVKK